jgi:hypothetical protein
VNVVLYENFETFYPFSLQNVQLVDVWGKVELFYEPKSVPPRNSQRRQGSWGADRSGLPIRLHNPAGNNDVPKTKVTFQKASGLVNWAGVLAVTSLGLDITV